jgi:hypothetical protein
MLNVQQKRASLLALSLFFAAAGIPPALADGSSSARSTNPAWNGRAAARMHLTYPGYANDVKAGAKSAPSGKAPDDVCGFAEQRLRKLLGQLIAMRLQKSLRARE